MEKGLLVWVVQLTLHRTPGPLSWTQSLQTWTWDRKWTHPVHGPSGHNKAPRFLHRQHSAPGTKLFRLLPSTAVSRQRVLGRTACWRASSPTACL